MRLKLKSRKSAIVNRKLLYAVVLLYSVVPVQAKILPGTAALIPPETVLLVDIENFSQLKQQFEQTKAYKLYKDASMKAFVEDFKGKLREKIEEKGQYGHHVPETADNVPPGCTDKKNGEIEQYV